MAEKEVDGGLAFDLAETLIVSIFGGGCGQKGRQGELEQISSGPSS